MAANQFQLPLESSSIEGLAQRHTFDSQTGSFIPCEETKRFIKGPVPYDWMCRANALPGKAGAVGIALWFLVGVKRTRTFRLTIDIVRIARCTRKAIYRALEALEEAGLIQVVERRRGRKPVVTVL